MTPGPTLLDSPLQEMLREVALLCSEMDAAVQAIACNAVQELEESVRKQEVCAATLLELSAAVTLQQATSDGPALRAALRELHAQRQTMQSLLFMSGQQVSALLRLASAYDGETGRLAQRETGAYFAEA